MRRLFIASLAAAISLLAYRASWAQLNVISQSRSLVTTAGPSGPSGVNISYSTQTPSDADTQTGVYDNSVTGSVTGSYSNLSSGQPNFSATVNATPTQNSTVSPTVLSAQASVTGVSDGQPAIGFGPINASGESLYSASFSVVNPTALIITESDIARGGANISDATSTFKATLSLTDGAVTIQNWGFASFQGDFYVFVGPVYKQDDPAPFTTELLPGNIYTLSMDVYVDTAMSNDADPGKNDLASLSFTATLPEPGSVGLLASAAMLALRRGKRLH